jgi:hypothetical protein
MSMVAEPEARVAVSLTPLALEADSRAFRIARSFAEAGYRSIVVEGVASARHFWDDAIEVRSLGRPRPAQGPPAPRLGRGHRLVTALREGRAGGLGEALLYAGFRGDDWWRHGYQLRRQLPAASLYYLHSFEFYRALAPHAARLGASVIYDAHDFYRGIEPPAAQRPFDRNRLRPFLDRLENRALAEAAAIVTVSDGVAGLIEHTCGRRPVVIRNCHDDRHDQMPEVDLRTALGLSADHRLCVVVGNWKPGMAVEAAIAALGNLPERFHLAFLGRGYEAIAAAHRQGPVAGRLHVGHVVAPNEVVPAIRSADLGLVLYEPYSKNYRHALPNGFFQVIAAGLPLVRGHLPEIEAAIGGHIVGQCLMRLDPPQLAEAILECVVDSRVLRAEIAWLAHGLLHLADTVLARTASSRAMQPVPSAGGHPVTSGPGERG